MDFSLIMEHFRAFNAESTMLRLILALVFGGLIGLEREGTTRSAGLRTNSLVCIGATLVMLTGNYIQVMFMSTTDVARLGAQVVSGIGFLGAGTIMVSGKHKVIGLTTAAALWICSVIGLALGIGFYEGAIACWILSLTTLKVLKVLDKKYRDKCHFVDLYVELKDPWKLTSITEYFKDNGITIISLTSTQPRLPTSAIGVNLVVKVHREQTSESILRSLVHDEDIAFAHKVYV